ncbi:transmembrane protein 65-like [Corticium candelabrum]|uniref:transmembrane protein 65-like n=1 Tax=Corticium candelabrum TaxID=121492 RepID=UPI002E26EF31|nr:transmembrane protein 65-like [Corticium candelabrum]
MGRGGDTLGAWSLSSGEKARVFVNQLGVKERSNLLMALKQTREESLVKSDEKEPTRKQLLRWAGISGIPFIGFGLVDNCVMITAGEYIDISIGASLGITTMAAAALGNMVSDVSGLGLAGTIEGMAAKLGSRIPQLSPKQLMMTRTRLSSYLGRVVGVCIGCFLGMFPLLLLSTNKETDDE